MFNPDQIKYTKVNTWNYQASINPDEEPELYDGDATTEWTPRVFPSSAPGLQRS